MIHGYKVFNPDWTCMDYKYAVGHTYEMDAKPLLNTRGFHFCTRLVDCYNYYPFEETNRVAEVIALGDTDHSKFNSKVCTNKIEIVRELSWEEILELVDFGKNVTV